MFKDFYKNIGFKKTTPEEKKEVIENTGDWFPEEHENKIRGAYELTPETNKYGFGKCLECGKTFVKNSNVQKYCSENCRDEYSKKATKKRKEDPAYKKKIANKKWYEEHRNYMVACQRAKSRGTSVAYEQSLIENGTNPIKEYANRKGRRTTEDSYKTGICEICGKEFQSYHGIAKFCKDCRSDAQCEYNRRYEEKRRSQLKSVEKQTTVFDELEKKYSIEYFSLMQKAISIVRMVKTTDDVKMCVENVYDILKKGE